MVRFAFYPITISGLKNVKVAELIHERGLPIRLGLPLIAPLTRPVGFSVTGLWEVHHMPLRDEDGPFDFVARRAPAPPSTPRTHQFTPVKFHNYFSSKIEPALHIAPGDTVNTRSVDAGGRDETGAKRSPGGNPLTGPFYIDGAWPGDTLVVKLNRARLNRGTASSGDQIVGSAPAPKLSARSQVRRRFLQ